MQASPKISFLQKYPTLFPLICFLFFLAIAALHFPNLQGGLFRDRWFVCMDYIAQGTLYEGQPYCEQGPVLFYILYFFYWLLGNSLYTGLTLFAVFLHTLLFFLLRFFIFTETRVQLFFSLLLSYTFFLYYPFLYSLDLLLATFFFFLALYTLFYTNYYHKLSFSLFFIFLAVFTKYLLLVPCFFLILYYLYTFRNALSQNIKTIFLTTVPLVTLLYFFLPTFFYYVSVAHTLYPKGNILQAALDLFFVLAFFHHQNIYFLFLILMIVFGFFFFYKSRSLFSFLLSFPFLILVLIFMRQTDRAVLSLEVYFIPFYFLFFLCVYLYYFTLSWKHKRVLILLWLLFLTPFLLYFYQDQLFVASSRLTLHAGSDFLSSLDGAFLVERKPNSLSLRYDLPYLSFDNKIFYLLNPIFLEWDTTSSPRIIFSAGFNASTTFYKRSVTEIENMNITERTLKFPLFDYYFRLHYVPFESDVALFNDIINKRQYDVALIRFFPFDAPDNYFSYSYLYDLFNYSQISGVSHCSVAVPFLQNSDKPVLYVYFSDFDTCAAFKEEISRYYAAHYDDLCLLSFDHAETVRNVLQENAQILPSCQETSSFTFDFFGNTSFHP